MIDIADIKPVVEWAKQAKHSFVPNGAYRQFCILNGRSDAPQNIWNIKKQIEGFYNIHNAKQEPEFKDFCGFITKGGAVHPHKDSTHAGYTHTRFNVLLTNVEGGMPVINDKVIDITVGSVWVCEASKYEHYCTPVESDEPRIVLSFGYLL